MDQHTVFGFPDDQNAFQNRNKEFILRFPRLKAAFFKVFDAEFLRSIDSARKLDRVIFYMGRLCIEDFFEILLLAANGYGFGALKILRALYERAVTLKYLSQNPNEVDDFLNYSYVEKHKILDAWRFSGCDRSLLQEVMGQEGVKKVEGGYGQIPKSTRKSSFKWSKFDFVTMAKKTGALGERLASAYYLPLCHGHATAVGLLARLEPNASGVVDFNPGPQPREADEALRNAHWITLSVLETQQEHFKTRDLEAILRICNEDYSHIWHRESTAEEPRS